MAPPEEDLTDLFEHAPCGYLSLLPDGKIFKANFRFSDWTGFPQSELVGRQFHDLLSIAGRIFYETHFAPLLRMQGFFDEVALDVVTASGVRLPVLANARERRDVDGRLIFTRVAIFRAHERRKYERDLVDARAAADSANAALSVALAEERNLGELREQFIAVLGHDLRNPLASIDGGARLLLKEPLSGKAETILHLMRSSVVRMSGLIDNVLDFARGRLGGGISLNLSTVAMGPVLDHVVAELRVGMADREIQASFDLEAPVTCDYQRIAQLVSNLLANAIVHGAKDRPVAISAKSSANAFEVAVSNSGPSIEAAAMERLFLPFFRGDARRSQQGLGLGLHIAAEIAKAHGGTVTVHSDCEITRFTFLMSGKWGS